MEISSYKNNLCKYCKKQIEDNASVCYFCHNNQNRFIQGLKSYGNIIAFIMMIISGFSAFYSAKERISAEKAEEVAKEASDKAVEALESTKQLLQKIQNIEKSIKTIDDNMRLEILTMIELSFYQVATKDLVPAMQQDKKTGIFYTHNSFIERLTNETKKLLPYLIPNEEERAEWFEKITKEYPIRVEWVREEGDK